MNMKVHSIRFGLVALAAICAFALGSCDRNPFSGSKLNLANYDKISTGMSKSQVEKILGAPTTVEGIQSTTVDPAAVGQFPAVPNPLESR